MKRTLLILVGIFLIQLSAAQAPQVEWQTICNSAADFSHGTGLANSPDNGYVIKVNDGVNNIKLNSSGNLVWQQMYHNAGMNISNAHGGGYVFVGNGLTKIGETGNLLWEQGYASGSYVLPYSAGLNNAYLTGGGGVSSSLLSRVNETGGLVWEVFFQEPNMDKMAVSTDGNAFVTFPNNTYGVLIKKLDIENGGSTLWEVLVDDIVHSDNMLYFLTETSDGGCALLTTNKDSGGTGAEVTKIDASGNFQWNHTYGNPDWWFMPGGIIRLMNGNIAFAGVTFDFAPYNHNITLCEIDLQGNEIWNHIYYPLGNYEGFGLNLIQTNDQGFLLTGKKESGDNMAIKLGNTSVLSTNENRVKDNVFLYPNPSSGNFTIETKSSDEISSLKINDLSGKTVYSEKLSAASKNLNVEGRLPSGAYIIEVQLGNGKKEIKKLIIRK